MSSITRERPSLDQWLKEAKAEETAGQCGMYLVHNGTVRETARAFSEDMRALGGAQATADAIVRFLKDRSESC